MPPTSYYHQSRDRSVYSKNFKQLLDHSIVVVVVVVVFLSNAMFSNYVLSFAQTTGVVNGCSRYCSQYFTSTLRQVVACVQASPDYLVTCGSGYCFIIYSKLNTLGTRPENDWLRRYANVSFPHAKKEIGDVCTQAS